MKITETPDTVYLFVKKTCPQCGPTRSLVDQHLEDMDLSFEEVLAEEPNLEECFDLGIDRTPAVVINVRGDVSGPFYEPVKISDVLKNVKNAARRQKEKEEASQEEDGCKEEGTEKENGS